MRRNRRVKIIATLGPASSDKETIEKLFIAGADVFRINMSHASIEMLSELHRTIRKVEAESGRPIGILVDLQGPKLRVGEFASGSAELVEDASFTFDRDEKPGSADRVYLPHPEIFEAVEPGHSLILDDGKRRLSITEVSKEAITAKVVVGGPLA
ncbi:MAG: pyruvate kinase, partial [Hyphomicrobiales bacterium]|nr:pyruvate kinase [Hyphomicrobiales bacterium]